MYMMCFMYFLLKNVQVMQLFYCKKSSKTENLPPLNFLFGVHLFAHGLTVTTTEIKLNKGNIAKVFNPEGYNLQIN